MSKRYEAIKKIQGILDLPVAVEKVKEGATAKFDETVEVSVNLNLLKKHTVRDTVVYPHGFGVSKRVLVFAQEDKVEEAKSAGADYVGGEDLIEKIQGGWLDFDVAISTSSMMRHVAKVARILGSKGLMPNPKAKTVTDDVGLAVKEIKAGRREFRANEHGVVNFAVGKVSMSVEHLVENTKALFDVIVKKKPVDLKGDYVRSVFLASTMGRGVSLDKKLLKS